jgi:phosphatidate cytidylyltransferase
MALNKQVFRTRALSSLFFVIIMLLGLLLNVWSFFLLFSVIHFGCWREYLRLLEKISRVKYHRHVKLGFMVSGYGIMLSFCTSVYHIGGYGIKENGFLPLTMAGFILIAIGILQKNSFINFKNFGAAVFGWLYISVSCGMMLGLRQVGIIQNDNFQIDLGREYPLLLILSMWANDTFAYLVGSFIGKTPFSKISPKKTWEGTIGGFILCVVGMGTLGSLMVTGYMGWEAVIIAAIAGILGTLGDLFESKLKRIAGVKDSGTMLPGHGGFLDRFDSLLVATPFVFLFVRYFLVPS